MREKNTSAYSKKGDPLRALVLFDEEVIKKIRKMVSSDID